MLNIATCKKKIEALEEVGEKRSWKETVKTFLLIIVILLGLGTIVATGGGSSSSSSTTSGTVSGSGK
ncbi:MAG: hypothetical protein B1H13_06820 [Desulfobacteraceae bacterium 4484_190.3]|nr:MAG: hypothetical protein B1H13_06820 [Desulfobacteraceae bacterium 4484_190.3]